MTKRSLLTALALVAAIGTSGCGVGMRGPMPVYGQTSVGKFKAKSLHNLKNRFSKHHLVARMAPGQASPVAGVKVREGVNGYQIHELPQGVSLDQAIAAYQAASSVVSVEKLELYPLEETTTPVAAPAQAPLPMLAANDPYYFQQWSHAVTNVPRAWEVTRGREDVVVAVLDTGVDYTHPDLAGQVINGPDFAENKADSRDIDHHGTHVAGIIAAKADNGVGVAGIAPGTKVLALKIFEPYLEDGKFQGTFYNAFSLARAVQYAATQGGAKIINISAGIADDELVETMFAFARGKGVVICVSAGNKGSNQYTGAPKYADGVLAVHATDPQDRLARFSNYGTTLGVSAPGVSILSTVPTYANPYTGAAPHKTGYEMFNGTSMASPFVAGVTALVVSALMDGVEAQVKRQYGKSVKLRASDIPVTVVEDLIRQSAVDLGRTGRDEMYGVGRIDAGRALEAAADAEWVSRATKEFVRNNRR
ncbi:Thermophilic serine proteinase precursor [compost metagenome]